VFPFAAVVLVILGGLLVVLLPPSAVFSYFVARRTTRRLSDLAEAARGLQRGDLSARSPVAGDDEVAQLQKDFNRMAEDLERMTFDLAEERDKVTRLLESRRELTASVSHELRTPVATLKGTLESALKSEPQNAEQLTRDLEVMAGEVDRLQRLIEDLFTLSRAEVTSLGLSLEAVNLETLVRRQIEAFSKLAWERSRVELTVEVSSGLDPVWVDPDRLEQVLANLLRNAVRHTPPGGIVAVRAAESDGRVRVEVCDTGPGIPLEELPRIWDRFYRGERARQAEPQGAGLGLALVRELTEAMEGRVSVQSREGEGSCFRLDLPKA
jgi:signal transduction histidine kinase